MSSELRDVWGSRVVCEASWAPFGVLYEYIPPTQVRHRRSDSAIHQGRKPRLGHLRWQSHEDTQVSCL